MAKRKRLRKQPRLQRVGVAGSAVIPNVIVPPAARKRKRRNSWRVKVSTTVLKKIAFSPRWMSLGLVTICLFALLLIGTDDAFYLTSVPVTGNDSISSVEIINSSGLMGSHIFSANPSDAANRINQVPGIISATVTLEWPDQVHIQVSEDSPVALWKQNGQIYWITKTGELVPARAERPGFLLIEAEENEPFGDELFVPDDVLAGALMLRELRSNIDHLYYRVGNGLSYQDGRGWRVFFGSGAEMEQKLVVYETIVDDLLSRSITPAYISVRNEIKPYYSTSNS